MVETRASKARRGLQTEADKRDTTEMARATIPLAKSRVLKGISGSGVDCGHGKRSTPSTAINIGPAPTNSRLLDLAPELRNRIYEYVLIEEAGIIKVDSATNPPALLMYYNQNEFRLAVVDCDLRLLVRWLCRFHRYAKNGTFCLSTTYPVQDPSKNWSNLVQSMRLAFHKGLALNLRDSQALVPDHVRLIDKAVDITNTAFRQGLAWENLEYRLQFYLLPLPPLVHSYQGF